MMIRTFIEITQPVSSCGKDKLAPNKTPVPLPQGGVPTEKWLSSKKVHFPPS